MKRKPRDPAWAPVDYDAATITAIQALSKGIATEGQQAAALRWIVEQAAGAYELSFRSDQDGGDRETAFAEGRRFVGLQIIKMVNAPGSLIDKLRRENG